MITFTDHLHGCQKQGLKDLIFVSRLRQSVEGRATMAKTIQCADGLEKVRNSLQTWQVLVSMLDFLVEDITKQAKYHLFEPLNVMF